MLTTVRNFCLPRETVIHPMKLRDGVPKNVPQVGWVIVGSMGWVIVGWGASVTLGLCSHQANAKTTPRSLKWATFISVVVLTASKAEHQSKHFFVFALCERILVGLCQRL